MRQEGEKGNPVYTGKSTQQNAVRHWRWPYWDKDSVYFLSTTRIGSDNVLKTRLYHDTYENGLDMHKDATYSRHDRTSACKDTSKGATIGWANDSLRNHELASAARVSAWNEHVVPTPQAVMRHARAQQAYVVAGHIPRAFGKMTEPGLRVLLRGDPQMRRPYVVLTPGARHHAARLADYLVSPAGQAGGPWLFERASVPLVTGGIS